MPMLNVFKSDAFSVAALTAAVLKQPHKPGRIGTLGLFRERGIISTTAVVEEKDGRLSLISTTPRGGSPSTIGAQKRTARSFVVPHLERESVILADEVQNVRSFGSENEVDAVMALVAERQTDLRSMHEVTLEHHRVGAIKGQVLDADGATVIYNLFTEFGVAQNTLDIALSNAATNVRNRAIAIQRAIETELGGEAVTGYRGFCGDNFFDKLVGHAKVEASLQYQESALLRTDLRAGFEFGGIVWENYRGKVLKPDGSGSVDFFPTEEAYVVPVGPRIFETAFAPADFMETVNTVGLPMYTKIAVDEQFQRWAKVHSQSNPLNLCTRPRAVVKVTNS
jgi:major capsid protein E